MTDMQKFNVVVNETNFRKYCLFHRDLPYLTLSSLGFLEVLQPGGVDSQAQELQKSPGGIELITYVKFANIIKNTKLKISKTSFHFTITMATLHIIINCMSKDSPLKIRKSRDVLSIFSKPCRSYG